MAEKEVRLLLSKVFLWITAIMEDLSLKFIIENCYN